MSGLIALYRRNAAAYDARYGEGAALREGIVMIVSLPSVITLIALLGIAMGRY